MGQPPHRKTGNRRKRGRENRRVQRDKKIFSFLRRMMSVAEHLHALHGVPIEPLSVFDGHPKFNGNPGLEVNPWPNGKPWLNGKDDVPWDEDLTPFPIGVQENGLRMPQWDDLSQWMKVMMATMAGHQWDLETFNIHLSPDLERELVASDKVRPVLAERARKHLTRAVGRGREFFFVIESYSKHTLAPTFLHIHGAAAIYENGEDQRIKEAFAAAAGHPRGAKYPARAVHSDPFTTLRAGYGDYLFKFAKQFDPRLDDRRLVMSQSMTRAARDLWIDITRPSLRRS